MNDKETLILRGQSMIMEMLMNMMPACLEEAWLDDVNQFNQEVIDLFGGKTGIAFKKPSAEIKEDIKE